MSNGYAIAVTSGKGGVGKSNLSVNLALALQRQGKKVALFDADLSLANAHILMGITPDKTIVDLLDNKGEIEDICMDGPLGVKLISGGSGLNATMNLSADSRKTIITKFRTFSSQIDYLVVDTAAGIDDNVADFVYACNRVLVMVVGEPSAFIDAYATIKVLSQNDRIRHFDIVINRARNEKHGQDVFNRFKTIVDRFLTTHLYHVATIPEDNHFHIGAGKCQPILLSAPSSKGAKAIEALAANITGSNASPLNEGDASFFPRHQDFKA
jgi:flagellar biosynthesis protein FlhG